MCPSFGRPFRTCPVHHATLLRPFRCSCSPAFDEVGLALVLCHQHHLLDFMFFFHAMPLPMLSIVFFIADSRRPFFQAARLSVRPRFSNISSCLDDVCFRRACTVLANACSCGLRLLQLSPFFRLFLKTNPTSSWNPWRSTQQFPADSLGPPCLRTPTTCSCTASRTASRIVVRDFDIEI